MHLAPFLRVESNLDHFSQTRVRHLKSVSSLDESAERFSGPVFAAHQSVSALQAIEFPEVFEPALLNGKFALALST